MNEEKHGTHFQRKDKQFFNSFLCELRLETLSGNYFILVILVHWKKEGGEAEAPQHTQVPELLHLKIPWGNPKFHCKSSEKSWNK